MREPLIIGHRGASAVEPENTMAAFAAAIAAGADGIEFDVHLSRDGVPVIIHDETLQRTHGLRQSVADLTAEELREVRVPSLHELFELMVQNDMLLCLELKGSSAKLAEECCRVVNEFSLHDRVIVECFDLRVLQEVKGLRTAALFGRGHSHGSSDSGSGTGGRSVGVGAASFTGEAVPDRKSKTRGTDSCCLDR